MVRPALVVAHWFKWFDLHVIDGVIHSVAYTAVWVAKWDGRFDNGVVDGLVNVVGRSVSGRRRLAAQRADRLAARLRAVPGAGGRRRVPVADVVGDAGAGGIDRFHRNAQSSSAGMQDANRRSVEPTSRLRSVRCTWLLLTSAVNARSEATWGRLNTSGISSG